MAEMRPYERSYEKKALRRAFGEALVELGREDPRIVVLDADVCTSTMTHLFREAFPDRFYQIGIAEQNMFGIAAGMSTVEGVVPFVSTFAVFATERACNQVSISIAYPKNNVKINGAYAGIPTGKAGATHQSIQDLAIMRSMPNMVVIAPADAREVREVVRFAADYIGPVYIRTTRHETPVFLPEDYRFQLGRSLLLKEGDDITLIGTGVMTFLALESALELEKSGIDARVVHMSCLKPFDDEAAVKAARETAGIITMENHSIIGGLGGAVAEAVCEKCPTRVIRVGFPDVYGESGDDYEIFKKMGLHVDNVKNLVLKLLRER